VLVFYYLRAVLFNASLNNICAIIPFPVIIGIKEFQEGWRSYEGAFLGHAGFVAGLCYGRDDQGKDIQGIKGIAGAVFP